MSSNPEKIEIDHELIAEVGDHPGDGALSILRSRLHRSRLHIGVRRPQEAKEKRPKIVDPVASIKSFREATHFNELDEDLVVIEDTIGFERIIDDELITYPDSLEKARLKGKNSAVSYGVGRIGNHYFVGILFNFDFMGGSLGDVESEKIIRAFDLARTEKRDGKKGLPVIILYGSGGQRQQEAAAALWGMDKVVHVMNQFKDETNQPVVASIIFDTFGGATASGLPQADLVVALAGRRAGFAGPRVIKDFTGQELPEDAQLVERIYEENKTVQVILQDQNELIEALEIVLDASHQDKVRKPKSKTEVSSLIFEGSGYFTPLMSRKAPEREPRERMKCLAKPPTDPDNDIWGQYEVLLSDPRRPDFLYILRNSFDKYAPFFTGRLIHEEETGNIKLEYPAIAFAIAAIEDPRLSKTLWVMAIGNQPSYLQLPDKTIMKIHANPNAWDYRNEVNAMKAAQRLEFPLVSFIDTPGASPTLKDEQAAIYAAMSDTYALKDRFKGLTMSYVLGLLGSGGGGALTFWDHRVMLSRAQVYVAVPPSAAQMVYPKGCTKEDIIRTAVTARPNARFLVNTGQFDRSIQEAAGGAGNNPFQTALDIREDIIQTYLRLGGLTVEELLARRDLRIRGVRPIPMGHLSGKPPDRKSLIARMFHR